MSSNQYTVNIVNADELYIGGRKIHGLELGTLVVNKDAYGVGIGTDKPRLKLDISGNSGIRIPVGISGERPNNATIGSDATNLLGVLRYNTTNEKYEAVYDHESTSVDPSWCNFVIETGTNVGNNKVGINTGTTIPGHTLDVNGQIGINDYIIHNDDTDTKIGFPGANTFTITTGNIESMRVDSNGNMGIGKSPNISYKLDVNGTIGIDGFIERNKTSSNSKFGFSPSYSTVDRNKFQILIDGNNNTDAQNFIEMTTEGTYFSGTGGGNVGIGTQPTSSYKLDVNGSIRFASMLKNSTGSMIIDSSNYIYFESGGNTKMTMTSTGRLGIGVTSPSYPLDVNGPIRATSFIGDGANLTGMVNSDRIPTASSSVKGGVKVGNNLSIWNGVLSSTNTWPTANNLSLGTSYNVTFNTVKAGYNQDKTSYFGRAAIGYLPSWPDYATFAHIDCNTTTKYALFQTNGGGTYLNGTKISFRINNGADYMVINSSGYIGIGTANAVCPLHVATRASVYVIAGAGYWYAGYGDAYASAYTRALAAKFEGYLWVSGNRGIQVTSDRRVKQNIVEVNDDLALQQLRAIDVMYYDYIDKENYSEGKTIGFISQQVKEVIPMAVQIQGDYLPDEMREVSVVFDTFETTDDSGAVTKYKFMVNDLSGTKYKFKMLNGDKVETVELEKDENGYFTCDKQYDGVYVYGKWVDDFHILSKSKLFTVNFSATQQIDRIQQAEKTKLTAAETEINTLKTKNQDLETKLTNLIAQLKANNTIN